MMIGYNICIISMKIVKILENMSHVLKKLKELYSGVLKKWQKLIPASKPKAFY